MVPDGWLFQGLKEFEYEGMVDDEWLLYGLKEFELVDEEQLFCSLKEFELEEEDDENEGEKEFDITTSIQTMQTRIDALEKQAKSRTTTAEGEGSGLKVSIGQMSVAAGHVELYKLIINHFGDIVSPNLPKYQVKPTCEALNGLLDAVSEMMMVTPKTISQEKVLEWEKMVCFYGGVGLKVGWLSERVQRYSDLLVSCSCVDVDKLTYTIAALEKVLEAKCKEISTLEMELEKLRIELKAAQQVHSQFNFSFFDA